MKITTTHIVWGAIALIALSQGENVRSAIAKGNRIRQQQTEFSDRIRQNRTEARQAEQLSRVALDRVRNNCILVVDRGTKKESYFQPGADVVDRQIGRNLRHGVAICNRLGDTAIVRNGSIADVARVSVPDLPKFKQLMQQRKNNGTWK